MDIKEAIKWIDNRMRFGRGTFTEHHPPVIDEPWIAGTMAIEALRKTEWIPCKRRLPEEGVVVLVCMDIKGHKFDWEEQRCIEFGRISSDRYDIDGAGWEWLNESGTDFWEPDWNDNILAWMPLPEPWKGATDE